MIIFDRRQKKESRSREEAAGVPAAFLYSKLVKYGVFYRLIRKG